MKHLQKTEFKNLKIPLPLLKIQKQIVRKCEKVEKYQELIKDILVKCDII